MTAPYVWQETQWQQLKSARDQGRFPHALLLNGAMGTGIYEFAIKLANYLLCEQSDITDSACGECKSCLLFKAGSHPDFRTVQPEEEGKAIKIDMIRELSGFLELKSQYGRHRITIIVPAEAMNKNAANSLLKTLEEPPADAIIILVNPVYMQLPITIRSRCQRVIFAPPSIKIGTQWLAEQGIESDDMEMLLEMLGNAPLDARASLESADMETLQGVITDLNRLMHRKADPVVIANTWKSYVPERLLEWLNLIIQDMIKDRFNTAPPFQSEAKSRLLQESRNKLDLSKLYQLLDKLHEYKRIINSGIKVNMETLLEDFLICWLT